MIVRRYLLALACVPFLACATADKGGSGGSTGGSTGSGTGGTKATGGSVGSTGGSPGTGGANTNIPGLAMGGPFAFPQSKVSGTCTLTTVANAASATMAAYSSWKSTYVTSSGAPSGALRVQDPQTLNCAGNNVSNGTVSEGMGYGMLAAVYMGDRTTFDQLLAYVNAHLDPKGLMTWCLNSSGNTIGSYSASDADEDIIWALLMASDQWSSTSYLITAQNMITVMRNSSLFSDGTLQNGDNTNTADFLNPDYFSPAYYRVFAKATGDTFWSSYVIDSNYKHLAALTGTDGLVPDESDLENETSCSTCKATYGYDACRTPWRIAMDYCFNGEARALTYLQKVGAFFNGVGAANIGDGYSLTGQQTSGNHNMAFIGPAGTAGMIGMGGLQTLLDGAFTFGVSNPGNGNDAYFPQSLRVVTMLMMSGNFLDYTQQQ